MKKKVNVVLNIFIVFLMLAIVLFFSLKGNFNEIVEYINKMNPWYLILAIIMLIIYRTLIGISSYIVTITNGCKFKLLRSIQINFIILFFHGITPFAGGGQPMEIYYLHNDKVSKTRATNITVQNFIIYQTALLLVELLAIIYNKSTGLFTNDTVIKKLVAIGIFVNFCVWLVTFILSFGTKINKFILKFSVKVLGKLKIVKNVDESKEKIGEWINKFHSNAMELKKNKLRVATCVLINMIALIFQYSVAYFVLKGLGVNNITYINTVVMISYVMVIGAFVPIPGGSGGLEYGFLNFFGEILTGGILTTCMLIWRFVSYYIGVILGAICLALYRKKDDLCE